MAAQDGSAPEHLSFLAEVAEAANRYGVFPVLRGAEARAPGLPRIGLARNPSQDIVELRQAPTLSFPGSTLESVRVEKGRGIVSGYWLGFTGPMGPLPLHLTEFALYERRYTTKRPFGRFLDVLAGRMLQFFYRAWADSQPPAQADRPEDDHFARYLAALSGATEGVTAASPLPARARLRYAGAFASKRSPAAIQDVLSDLLRTKVKLLEFQPRWRGIEAGDRTRLAGPFNCLGADAVIGARVWGVSDAFRVVVRATSLREYEDFLPSGVRHRIAAEALDALRPSHLEWDLALELDQTHARPMRLNGLGRLGWTGWLCPDPNGGVRADAHLGLASRRLARPRHQEVNA
jgi:type VI secretion system ImpH/TssG family protein